VGLGRGRDPLPALAVARAVLREREQQRRGLVGAGGAEAEDRPVAHVDVRVAEQLGEPRDRGRAVRAAVGDRGGGAQARVAVAERVEQRGRERLAHRVREALQRAERVVAAGRSREQVEPVGPQELGLVVLPPQVPAVVAGHRQRGRRRRVGRGEAARAASATRPARARPAVGRRCLLPAAPAAARRRLGPAARDRVAVTQVPATLSGRS
jgi:hypothetical protein